MIIKTEKIGQLSVWTDSAPNRKTNVTVYSDYRPIVSFDPNNNKERRLAAVQLVELGHCKNRVAGKICGFHRNTVSNLLRTKKRLGIEALLEDNRGPKAPWKYIDSIQKKIKNLIREHPSWTDKKIAKEAEKILEMSVSESAVARIRTVNEDTKVKALIKYDLEQLGKIADNIDLKQHDEKQLYFNFESDPEFKKQVDEFSKEDPPEPQTNSDKEFLENLKKGQRNVFAGMLLHHLFLSHISFPSAIELPSFTIKTYEDYEIIETLFFGLNIGLPSIESYKLVNSRDMGILLGRSSSPDETTIRIRLSKMAEFKPSETLIDHFASLFLTLGFINPEVFFIDGHFLPYYGLKVLAKGFHTVRGISMKGNEIYVVSDIDGKPLLSITENCDIDFRPIILRAAEKIIDLGISRPILVFDRGGYGVHFFHELSPKADFVTWAKYVKKEELQDLEYTFCLMFNDKRYLIAERMKVIRESISTARKEGRTEATSTKVRMVVFKEIKVSDDGKVSYEKPVAIYTSNQEKHASDIVSYMLSRWGESENFFKEIMALYNFNYHPGYDLKELSEQPLVNNPVVKTIKRTIKGIKVKIGNSELEKLRTKEKLEKRKDKRLENKIDHLQGEIEKNTKDLEGFYASLEKTPEKVSILEVLHDRPMNKADLEKKRIYDLIQMIAFHSREYLIDIFRNCYEDPRDVKQILTKITKLSGYVKLIGKTLIVVLDWIEDKKHREAAIKFCNLINSMSPKLSGRIEFNLFFRISSYS